MSKWCWNRDNRAVDVVEQDPATLFHPDIAKNFEPCPDFVQSGYYWYDDAWHPGPEPEYKHIYTRYEFLSRFTAAERIAIRKAAKEDPIIEDFMAMLDICDEIDVRNTDTINGIDYLILKEIIKAERRSDILKEEEIK